MSTNINFKKHLGAGSAGSGISLPSASAAFSNTKSILLDGVDDYVNMGDVLNMADDGSDAFTISFWCKGIGGASIRGYVGKLTSSLDGYAIYRSNNIIFMLLGDYPSNAIMANYTFSGATDGNYHHIVWSYDGSQDVSGYTLYIDGAAVSLNTNFNNTPSNVITTEPFAIGSRGGAKFNNSNFDEVAYFNTELSASDVTSIYNSGVPNNISSLSPVSWWRCGDGDTSPTLTDNGSGGNNGTMTNFSTFSTDVPIELFSRKSIDLDGVDDYVDMGNVLNFERLDTFSISAWVKKNDNGSGMMIASKQETSGNYRGWMFYFDASNNLKFVLRRQNQTYNRLIATSTNSISAGSWSHVLVTYDGSSTEAGFNFYINGADAGSNGSGSTLGGGSFLATTIPLQIGARDSQYNFFDGNIDEVAIFNSELSASDVTTIYNSGVPNDISSLSPLSWWRCGDSDTSPTLTDNGSGGNNGTMTNFTTFSTDVPT